MALLYLFCPSLRLMQQLAILHTEPVRFKDKSKPNQTYLLLQINLISRLCLGCPTDNQDPREDRECPSGSTTSPGGSFPPSESSTTCTAGPPGRTELSTPWSWTWVLDPIKQKYLELKARNLVNLAQIHE